MIPDWVGFACLALGPFIMLLRWLDLRRIKARGGKLRAGSDPLDQPLVQLTPRTVWRKRDAFESVFCVGETGSGKTSGPGRAILEALLKNGWGGLITTVKPGDAEAVRKLCEKTGRLDDLVFFGPGHGHRFAFMQEELDASEPGFATENLVKLMMTLMERATSPSSGGSDDGGFFVTQAACALRSAFDAIIIGTGKISPGRVYEFISDSPETQEQARDRRWQESSTLYGVLEAGRQRQKTPREEHDHNMASNFWLSRWAGLADRTRTCVDATIMGTLDVLVRGSIRELFMGPSTITPAAIRDGKIIVCDLPVKRMHEGGRLVQVAFKYLTQRTLERNLEGRDAFIFVDECANFVTSQDQLFTSTSRAARCCTVYLTQNLPMLYAALGGEKNGKVAVDALVGNLATRIFCANSDSTTNEWAASMFGRERKRMRGMSVNHDEKTGEAHVTSNANEQFNSVIEPGDFARLLKGGPHKKVQAIVFKSGFEFAETGKHYHVVDFKQE